MPLTTNPIKRMNWLNLLLNGSMKIMSRRLIELKITGLIPQTFIDFITSDGTNLENITDDNATWNQQPPPLLSEWWAGGLKALFSRVAIIARMPPSQLHALESNNLTRKWPDTNLLQVHFLEETLNVPRMTRTRRLNSNKTYYFTLNWSKYVSWLQYTWGLCMVDSLPGEGRWNRNILL